MLFQLKALGIDNIMRFDWLSSPSPKAMIRALETLFAIGALDSSSRLTRPDGLRMAEMPLVTQRDKGWGNLCRSYSSSLLGPQLLLCAPRRDAFRESDCCGAPESDLPPAPPTISFPVCVWLH